MRPPTVLVAYGRVPARDLLRAEVARLHGVREGGVVLGHTCPRCRGDEHGLPLVLPTAELRRPPHVSLSRAGDLSVVAVTDVGEVGVDVEPDGAADFPGFDSLVRAQEDDAPRTRTWVRTEAALKSLGWGLAVDPREVRLQETDADAWIADAGGPVVAGRDVAVPGHVVAVAVLARGPLTVEVRAVAS